jgi:DNA mismatch endonuclease, patch repair protein
MPDNISPQHRSWNMSRIRSKHTRPEKAVRSLLHRMGYRFRIHRKDLPGSPDIVMSRYRAAIFVNGCFWHRHAKCRFAYEPKSRIAFWQQKFKQNVVRDKRQRRRLAVLKWNTFVIWECDVTNAEKLQNLLQAFFSRCRPSCR